MFSFGPVFALPEWLQYISILAIACCLQATTFALFHARWGSAAAVQVSLFVALTSLIVSGVLFIGISI